MSTLMPSNGHESTSNRSVDANVAQLDALEISGSTAEANSAAETVQHAIEMQQRCRLLLQELEQFSDYLREQKRENAVEFRTFKGGLQSEMKLLDKVGTLLRLSGKANKVNSL